MNKRRKQKIGKVLLCIALAVLLAAAGGYGYLRLRYPIDYTQTVQTYAAEFGLDPNFVLAVIWAESTFRPKSQSSAGACGLMQIMPETGGWIADKLGLETFSQEMLFDPAINIRMGCWYLSYLEQRFGGDKVKVLAGYNAGPKNVEKWQAEWPEGYMPQAKDIPFPETQQYVQRVSRAQKVYEWLYDVS